MRSLGSRQANALDRSVNSAPKCINPWDSPSRISNQLLCEFLILVLYFSVDKILWIRLKASKLKLYALSFAMRSSWLRQAIALDRYAIVHQRLCLDQLNFSILAGITEFLKSKLLFVKNVFKVIRHLHKQTFFISYFFIKCVQCWQTYRFLSHLFCLCYGLV